MVDVNEVHSAQLGIVDRALELDAERRALLAISEASKADRNAASKRIGDAMKAGAAPDGEEVAGLKAVSTAAGERIRAAELLLCVGRRALARGALSTAETSLRDARDLLSGRGSNSNGVSPRAAANGSPAQPGSELDAEAMLAIDIDEALVQALALAGDHTQLVPVAAELIEKLAAADIDPRREAMIRIRTALATSEDNPANAAEHLAAARAIADQMTDPALASLVDAVAAQCAIDAGELDRARELSHRSLVQAEDERGEFVAISHVQLGILRRWRIDPEADDRTDAMQRVLADAQAFVGELSSR